MVFTDGCSVGMNVGNCRLVVVCCWFGGLLGCGCVGLFYSASGQRFLCFTVVRIGLVGVVGLFRAIAWCFVLS